MEWSVERCIALIKEFEKHECLWNVQVAEYKNVMKKKDAWYDIGSIMDLNAEQVEQKMKSLLAAYRREKKKVVDSVKSGSGSDCKYTPKWFAYKHMHFLRDINRPKKTREVSDDKRQKETTYEEEKEENAEIYAEEPDSGTNTNFLEPVSPHDIHPTTAPSKKNLKRQNKKTTSMNENKGDIAFATMQSLMAAKDAKRTRDEYSAYGEVVGYKIRKLSTEYEREVTQFKINEILYRASMGHFRQSAHASDFSQPSSQASSSLSTPNLLSPTSNSEHASTSTYPENETVQDNSSGV